MEQEPKTLDYAQPEPQRRRPASFADIVGCVGAALLAIFGTGLAVGGLMVAVDLLRGQRLDGDKTATGLGAGVLGIVFVCAAVGIVRGLWRRS